MRIFSPSAQAHDGGWIAQLNYHNTDGNLEPILIAVHTFPTQDAATIYATALCNVLNRNVEHQIDIICAQGPF